MRARGLTLVVIASLLGLAAIALWLRADSTNGWLWRARLVSLVADRDADVRNNLLQDGGDPFALRRRLLAAPAAGGDAEAWRDFAAAAAAPRPGFEAMEAAAARLEDASLPRGAADAYRYLLLWSYWQRNRIGSAAATLDELRAAGLPAAASAARLAEAAGERGTVQLVIPGSARGASAGAGGTRYKLRRLLQLATLRLAVEGTLDLSSPPASRLELATFSVNGQDFARFAILPGGESEIVTPRTRVRGPGPWFAGGSHPVSMVWDAAAEEATIVAGETVLRAPGAVAALEPPAEIEVVLANAAPALLRDVVVAAAPRGMLPGER